MACDRFAEAMRARAIGAPLSVDAAAHLAVCSGCQAMLETEEWLLDTIDRALDEVTATGPSPEFISRLRTHVERAPQSLPIGWWTASATVTLAILVVFIVIDRVPTERSAARDAPASHPVESSVEAPTARAVEPSHIAPRPRKKPAARGRRQSSPAAALNAAMSEVLVPPQQREAVTRLFASLRAGQPEVVSMLMTLHDEKRGSDSGGAASRAVTIEPLRIDPVVISPLPSSASIFER